MKNELAAYQGVIREIFFVLIIQMILVVAANQSQALFYALQEKYQIDLTKTFFVGDNLSDIEVARQSVVSLF